MARKCNNEKVMSEADLQGFIAQYIAIQYPDILFHSDFGSGVKLTIRQAAKQKRQNGGRRAWPDMFIAEPKMVKIAGEFVGAFTPWGSGGESVQSASGLFLEFKRPGTRLKKKDGSWASEHIAEQAEVLADLRSKGYVAEFAVGWDEARRLVDTYLGGEE